MPAQGTEIRWNWNTPFILSPHNPEVVHAGGNRFFTSMDRGETWTMSRDLSRNTDRDMIELMGQANALPRCNQMDRGRECILSRNDGVSAWGAAVSLTESPLVPGLLWMGTDDGNLQVSRDGGVSWTEVGENIPGGTKGYYILTGLPVVRIDDVLVHPRDNDLVVATHGRSVLVMDDITPLQQLTPEVMEQDAFLFEPREAVAWKQNRMRSRSVTGDKVLRGDNALPGTAIHYYLSDDVDADDVSLTVSDVVTGEVFRDLEATGDEGINRVQWDLRGNVPEGQTGGGFGLGGPQAPVAEVGMYRVTLTVDGEEFSRLVAVVEDVWMGREGLGSRLACY